MHLGGKDADAQQILRRVATCLFTLRMCAHGVRGIVPFRAEWLKLSSDDLSKWPKEFYPPPPSCQRPHGTGTPTISEQNSLAVVLALHETVGGQLFYSRRSTYLTRLLEFSF
jgi:hypothetical protein